MKLAMPRFLGRMLGAKSAAPAPTPARPGLWRRIVEPFAGAWQLRTTAPRDEQALFSPIVFACMTLIANDVGKMRAYLATKSTDDIWEEAADMRADVLGIPNAYQTAVQFRQWWVMSKLKAGNTYVLKERDASGRIKALHVLDPWKVLPLVAENGAVFYQLCSDNLAGLKVEGITVPASEVIHDRTNCMFHPLVGISPLMAAAIASGIATKIQDNMLQFFTNKAQPGGLLIAPGALEDGQAEELQQQWDGGHVGDKAGCVAVVEGGWKFIPMSVSAVDAQLIETLKWSDERVCSVFHVPGFKVGVGQEPTHSNIEGRERAYYSDCIQILVEEMEAVLDRGLGFDGKTAGVELDVGALVRMDSKTQMETLKVGVDGSILTINNARKRLNLPPIAGGDTVYRQQQDYPLEQIRLNTLPVPKTIPEAA